MANIKSISAEDIKSYIATHYTAPRMVFAASGAVEHDQIVEQHQIDEHGHVGEHHRAIARACHTSADV